MIGCAVQTAANGYAMMVTGRAIAGNILLVDIIVADLNYYYYYTTSLHFCSYSSVLIIPYYLTRSWSRFFIHGCTFVSGM